MKKNGSDIVVLGAGPAGSAAAVEASALGLYVTLFDENPVAGGQVYRQSPGIRSTASSQEQVQGDALGAALTASTVDKCFEHRVWQVERLQSGFAVHAVGPEGPVVREARALIVASGATERQFPIAGWERQGVLSLAGATVLIKSQRMLPGRNVVVAGSGPLLMVVAAAIIEGGGTVAAVIDANPRRAWWADMGALASRPDLLARGAGWIRTLVAHRVPMLFSHVLRRIDGNPAVSRVEAVPIGAGGAPLPDAQALSIQCDSVCTGFGLLPSTDVTRLVGAAHIFDAVRDTWQVKIDADQRCSLAHLYACGDGTGVAGAAAAPWQGRVAALAAAHDLGILSLGVAVEKMRPARRQRDIAARFGMAMARLANVRPNMVEGITDATVVCLCEGITRATLDAAIDLGCVTQNDLRSATRCGMGPCGGRLCEDVTSRLIAARTGLSRQVIGQPTGRPPLRPVDLNTLAGTFDYDSLPMAQPSPL